MLFVLGDCVDYWWIGTTRASDSAVLSLLHGASVRCKAHSRVQRDGAA